MGGRVAECLNWKEIPRKNTESYATHLKLHLFIVARSMATASKGKALEDRLRRALSLGLRASTSPLHDRRHRIWWNTDAEVQKQAVRAIQAFLNAHKSKVQSMEKSLLDDIVSALEGLLKAEPEQVCTLAADITDTLIIAGGTLVIGFRIQGLCASLVHLLARTRSSTACATALRIIVNDVSKLRAYLKDEDLWEVFKESNILHVLASQLQMHENFDGEGVSLYVSVADLLIAILDWRPTTRFGVGSDPNLRKSALMQCKNSNEAVCCAALRLCATFALCGGVALLQVQDKDGLCSCLATNTDSSKSFSIRSEAFHFLYILTSVNSLGTVVDDSFSELICTNITNSISEGFHLFKVRWPPDAKKLVLEASQAAQGLLRLPGKHHQAFWRAGFVGALCTLLLGLYDSAMVLYPKSAKYDQIFGLVLWDALSWLAINAVGLGEERYVRKTQQEAAMSKVIDFACAALLRVVDRRGIRTELHRPPDHLYTGMEGVAICKAILSFLFSPSHYLAITAKHCLDHALQQQGYDWLSSSVSRLSLLLSLEAASETMNTVMTLMAMCCLSVSAHCQQQLSQNGVLDSLIRAIKSHSLPLNKKNCTSIAAGSCFYRPLDRKFCCSGNPSTWEGKDPILFLCLWAFASLARGSDTAKGINASLKKRLSRYEEWDGVLDEEIDSCFLFLASSMKTAIGVRWWASCCLACCGAYGFPSKKGGLWQLFNNHLSADLKLVFVDGGHLHAHKVILATKCPALLPAPNKDLLHNGSSLLQSTASDMTYPMDINLSNRIREAPMKLLLEYIYKGFVFVDEDFLPEVKLLARRCGMDTFFKLLQGKVPVWGSSPDTLDFSPALGSKGCCLSDVFLEDKDGSQVGCIAAGGESGHQHAHRVILSSQCDYFKGLFRSGMQDSSFKVLKIPLHVEALKTLLHYLYSMIMPRKRLPEAGCMWSASPRSDQVKYLNTYVELAQLTEPWLLEDLKEQCLSVILDHLKDHMHLGPDVIKFAAACEQWWLAELVAECIAKDYPRMRESGELDALDDYLVDIIRAAHVKSFMNHNNGCEHDYY